MWAQWLSNNLNLPSPLVNKDGILGLERTHHYWIAIIEKCNSKQSFLLLREMSHQLGESWSKDTKSTNQQTEHKKYVYICKQYKAMKFD